MREFSQLLKLVCEIFAVNHWMILQVRILLFYSVDCQNIVQLADETTHSGSNILDPFLTDVLDRYNITVMRKICVFDRFPIFINVKLKYSN